TSEIGLRMALGARREAVVRMVLGEVAGLGVLGLALGLVTALVTSKFIATFLYGLRANDPATLAAAAATRLAAALLAGYAAARLADRADDRAPAGVVWRRQLSTCGDGLSLTRASRGSTLHFSRAGRLTQR